MNSSLIKTDCLPTFRNSVFRIKNRVVFATEKGIYEYDAVRKRFIPSPLLYSIFGTIQAYNISRKMQMVIYGFAALKK